MQAVIWGNYFFLGPKWGEYYDDEDSLGPYAEFVEPLPDSVRAGLEQLYDEQFTRVFLFERREAAGNRGLVCGRRPTADGRDCGRPASEEL